jgi:hypothetical protein
MAEQRDDKKDDATPRTDAAEYAGRVMASFARQLERELAIAKKRLWIELEAPTTIGTQSAELFRNAAPGANKGSSTGSPVACTDNGAAPITQTPGELATAQADTLGSGVTPRRDGDSPYTPDEQRAADYIVEITKGDIGGGDDPIGFLILSHATLVENLKESRAAQSATGACRPVATPGYDRCRFYFEAEERGYIRRTDSRRDK